MSNNRPKKPTYNRSQRPRAWRLGSIADEIVESQKRHKETLRVISQALSEINRKNRIERKL